MRTMRAMATATRAERHVRSKTYRPGTRLYGMKPYDALTLLTTYMISMYFHMLAEVHVWHDMVTYVCA